MRLFMIIAGVILGLVLVVLAVGWALPVRHQASREAVIHATPQAVYDVITDVAQFPKWRSGITDAQKKTVDGKDGFTESGSDGTITYAIEDNEPGRKLVTRIADDDLPFGGRWTYELLPEGPSTRVRITEHGEVYNPFFRFMSRYIFGHEATMTKYLEDLQKRMALEASK